MLNNTDVTVATSPVSWPSVYFEDTGYAVLRSDNKTVVLRYGPHGGAHGHPDKLSIPIHMIVRLKNKDLKIETEWKF